MKIHCLLACAVMSVAFALPPVRPVLPLVENLDTETVTNMPFTAWQRNLRDFTVKLSFVATPSNNMEIAFGTDTGTTGILLVGDGELSPDECDLIVGWDCGSWFVEADENVRAGERFSAQVTPQGTSMRLR